MQPVPHQLQALVREALRAAQAAQTLPDFPLPDDIPITLPKREGQGDYASPVAMALAKAARQKPLDIANAVLAHMPESPLLARAEVAPPGFLNLWLDEAWLRHQVEAVISQGAGYFQQTDIGAGQRAQVEFVSANPTGPLHIGRTRGAILGDALSNLLEACGWEVQREYYFNNAGRQMQLLGESLRARYLQALGQDAPLPEEDAYKGDYLITMGQALHDAVGDAWAQKDWPAFKEHAEAEIFKMIKATLARVRIRHDDFFNEQSVYDDNSVWETLEKLRAAGMVYESVTREDADPEEVAQMQKTGKTEPATWFRTTKLGDDQDRVLVKSNGDPTYVLPDIAYHVNKLERGFEKAYNVLGVDHIVEAQTVAYGLQALGYDPARVEVLFHQFVTFPDGRMSTRAGNYVTLDDLIDVVGADAVRYFMLARSPNSHLEFDFELATNNSRENPVFYIQNAHVRCCGIFRQAAERGLPEDWDADADLSLLGEAEMAFVRGMIALPEQIAFAYETTAPHQIAFYALDLARTFHPLYDDVRVLHSDVPEDLARARLRFYRAARITFHYLLTLLGMDAPETM